MKKVLKSMFLLLSAGCFAATSWANSLIARWDNFTGLTSEQTLAPTASATVNGLNGSTWTFNLGGGTVTDGVLATGKANAPHILFPSEINIGYNSKPLTVLIAIKVPVTSVDGAPFVHMGNGTTNNGIGFASTDANKVCGTWSDSHWNKDSNTVTIETLNSQTEKIAYLAVFPGSGGLKVAEVLTTDTTANWKTIASGLRGSGFNASKICFGNYVSKTDAATDGLDYSLTAVAVFNGEASLADMQAVLRGWQGVTVTDVAATLEGDATWAEASWTPSDPTDASNATLTVNKASTLTMGAEASVISLTVNGTAPLTIDGAKLTTATTAINTNTTVEAGAATLGAVTIADGKTLTVKDQALSSATIASNAKLVTMGDISANASIAANATLNVVSGTTTLGAGDRAIKGTITIDSGAELVATSTDALDYNNTSTINVYGTLNMSNKRWTVFDGNTFNVYAGGSITGAGESGRTALEVCENNTFNILANGDATNVTISTPMRSRDADDVITFNVASNLVCTYAGRFDGAGKIKAAGSGTLKLTTQNANGVIVDEGAKLEVAHASAITTVENDGTLTYTVSATPTNAITNNGTVAVEGSASVLDLAGATLDGDGVYTAAAGTTLKLTLAQAETLAAATKLTIAEGATLQVVLSDVEKLVRQDVPGVTKVVFVDAAGNELTEEGEEAGSNNAYVPAIPSCVYTVATGTWSVAPVAGAKVTIDFTGTENLTVDLATLWTVDAFSKLTITGAGTVTVTTANTYTGGTDIAEGATVVISNANALGTGPVTGAGTIETNVYPTTGTTDFNAPASIAGLSNGETWTGTLKFNTAGDILADGMRFDNLGNANSTIEITEGTTLKGYFSQYNWSTNSTVVLDGTLYVDDGFSFKVYKFNKPLQGKGEFKMESTPTDTIYFVNGVDAFTGNLTLNSNNRTLVIGTDSVVRPANRDQNETHSENNGKLVIAKAITIAANKTWAANGGIKVIDAATIAGTGTIDSALTYASTATSTFGGTLTGGLTVSSGALKLTGTLGTVTEGVATYANTISLASGTTLTLGLAQETALNGVISGEGALTINSGKIALNAENTATGKTTVEPGATIAGSGNVGGTLQLDNGSTLDATDGYLNVAGAVWLMGHGTNTTITLPTSYGVGTPIIACGVEAATAATDLTAKFDGYICEVDENNVIKLALAEVTVTLPTVENASWYMGETMILDETITVAPGTVLTLKADPDYLLANGDVTVTVTASTTEVTVPEGTLAKLIVATVADTGYTSFEAAVEAATNNNSDTIVLNANIVVANLVQPVVIPEGTVLDLNGYTSKGTILGTIDVNGGTYVTAQGQAVIGTNARTFETTDAVFTMDAVAGNISLDAGTVTAKDQDGYGNNWTIPDQTLTIKSGVELTIPAGVTMQVNGSAVIVEDGAKLNIAGGINLCTADATITTSDATMTITTSVAGCEVQYVGGKYTVVESIVIEDVIAKTPAAEAIKAAMEAEGVTKIESYTITTKGTPNAAAKVADVAKVLEIFEVTPAVNKDGVLSVAYEFGISKITNKGNGTVDITAEVTGAKYRADVEVVFYADGSEIGKDTTKANSTTVSITANADEAINGKKITVKAATK